MTETSARGSSGRVADALLDALAVLLPVACAGCGVPDRSLCGDCRRALVVPTTTHTVEARDGAPALEVVAALAYEGVVRAGILALKEQGRTDIASALGPPLARAIAAVLEAAAHDDPSLSGIRIAAVPQGSKSARARGYDPVPLLLRYATGRTPERMLRRVVRTRSQKLLGIHERRANLAGTLQARRPLLGVPVLLVDDVLTTGSTLQEAARAITAAGGTVVGAAALAATPLRQQRRGEPQINVS